MLESAIIFTVSVLAVIISVTTIAFIVYGKYLEDEKIENPIFKYTIIFYLGIVSLGAVTLFTHVYYMF